MKGAIDDIEQIDRVVTSHEVPAVHYHADASLFGGFLPFIDLPGAPEVNFQLHPFDSIALSGHKFFGSPIPLGLFYVAQSDLASFESDTIESLGTSGLAIWRSRNSLRTLIWWWIFKTGSEEIWRQDTAMILEGSDYLHRRLREANIPSGLNPFSNIVYFPTPSKSIQRQWALPTMTDPHLGPIAHVVVMQHVNRELIDAFITDYLTDQQAVD